MYLWTAFTIGLFGSMHCVGMCGPIAMALPGRNPGRVPFDALLYNVGRTLTYASLGGVIGLIGKGVYLAGFQKTLSIGMGIALLVVALFSVDVETRLLRLGPIGRCMFFVKSRLGVLLKNNARHAPFLIGLFNGFLPCGLVYMAMAGALSTGGLVRGMSYMALFGLGTMPLMFVTVLLGNQVSLRWRSALRKVYPFFLVFFAVLFLFRGLNFTLPYDFFFWEKMSAVPMCH